jgi:hypothetical protein
MDSQKATELIQVLDPKDQIDALNGMVLIVNIAYKRGAYSLIEAAKIWECLQQFAPKEEAKEEVKEEPKKE